MTGENKDVYRKKRASNAYHLLVPLFSSFMGSVVCHTLPLFSKSLLGIISFDFLHDSFTCALPLFSLSCLLFMLIPSTTSHLWNQPCHGCRCSQQYADALLTLLHFFFFWKCAHYIMYIYIQTLAQNRTAFINISCLAMLGNIICMT